MDSSFVDYYYGVEEEEADRIEAIDSEYRGAGSMVYNLRGNITYIYNEDLTFTWLNGISLYDNKIERSPITDKKWSYYTGGMATYKFK